MQQVLDAINVEVELAGRGSAPGSHVESRVSVE